MNGEAERLASGQPRALGLRGRLATALTALSAAAAIAVALAFWAGEEYLERDSLRELRHEGQAMEAYTDLARRRGYWLLAMVIVGTGAVAGLAWWLSGRLARRSLRPLDELVDQIRAIDLEQREHRLSLASPDPELQVIVSALNAHMGRIDALVERERAFAAAASHELRTPLTVIGGAASVLSGVAQVPAPVLARIDRAVAHARQDLEALLALSRGRERSEAKPVQLERLLRDIAALHVEVDPGSGTRVQWNVPAPVERTLAPGPLSIVFGNVLRNALRAARGGEVRIDVEQNLIRVSDTGPGFPPELLREEAFTAPAARRGGGTGMGLYIAQVLAQREGWTLALGGTTGGGASVELRF